MSAPPATLDEACLRTWPLPEHDDDDDKEARGRVLVIGGSSAIGGAVLLAGVSALRAGAGKVTVATSRAIAPFLSIAFPEARVVALDENARGGLSPDESLFEQPFGAVLVGPGMQDAEATVALARFAIERSGEAPVVLDAGALDVVKGDAWRDVARHAGRLVVTPHAGELAHLTGADKRAIAADPLAHAGEHARRLGIVVTLKGARTIVATPDGRAWLHDGGNVGLAVSGSGDTLAGIVAGLAARGASLEQAAAWGVVVHARAGDRLAARIGRVGFLAREIPAEVPALLDEFGRKRAGVSVGFTAQA